MNKSTNWMTFFYYKGILIKEIADWSVISISEWIDDFGMHKCCSNWLINQAALIYFYYTDLHPNEHLQNQVN